MVASGRTTPGRTGGRGASGISLLEVVIAGALLAVASVGVAAALAQGSQLSEGAQEEMAAWNALRAVRSRILAEDFSQAVALHHDAAFDVAGLRAVPGDADGRPGLVRFAAVNETGREAHYVVTVQVRWQGRAGPRSIENRFHLANIYGDKGTPAPIPSATEAQS